MKDYSKLDMLNVSEYIQVDLYVKIDEARKEKNLTEPVNEYHALYYKDDKHIASMNFGECPFASVDEMAMQMAISIGKEQAARAFLEWAKLQQGIIGKHSVIVALDKAPEQIKWFRYRENNSDFYNACVADHKARMSDPLYGLR